MIVIFLNSQMANPAPPLGSQLGQVGINIASFVKDFNLRTRYCPTYKKIRVTRSLEFFHNR
jgi:ribosomal protein L11